VLPTQAKKEKLLQHVGVTLRVDGRSPIVLLKRTKATNESSRVNTATVTFTHGVLLDEVLWDSYLLRI
jgi:hypothetical protein